MATLDEFEALYYAQERPRETWKPVTDYSFETRRQIEGRHPDVLIETFGQGPYLDYGCGPDAILVRLLRERGVMAYGIDPGLNPQWQCFRPHWDNRNEEFVGEFSVIICREVFEHNTLRDIQGLIQRFVDFQARFVYVTTRFSSEHDVFHVETSDELDPTHITIPSKDLIRLLFVLEGFKRRADLEAKMDWQQKNRCLVYERA